MRPTSKPPALAAFLFRLFAVNEPEFHILGDMAEEYAGLTASRGAVRARIWYWGHVLRALPAFVFNVLYWGIVMLKNYIKIAFRIMSRSKLFSFINVAGLAVGMACCLLIMLWVHNELSFDHFHDKSDRIHRLCIDGDFGTPMKVPATSAAAGPALIRDMPEVLDAVRLSSPGRTEMRLGDEHFLAEDVLYADSSLFTIFSFPLLSGDPAGALEAPYSVVLTRDAAEKYFGSEDPVGQVLHFENDRAYSVTGVAENIPFNSHLRFSMARSFKTLEREREGLSENWGNVAFFTYLLLDENASAEALTAKFPAFVEKYWGPILQAVGGRLSYFLQPLNKIYLHSDFSEIVPSQGDIAYIYLFAGIALFVLLIACVNFINLSTARAAVRANEVGVRKTFGADRPGLVRQFMGESLIYSLIAVILSVGLVLLTLPAFNALAGRRLSAATLVQPWSLASLAVMMGLVGLVAGSYPAFVLSAFRPVQVLRGRGQPAASGTAFRRLLVVVQFTISIALIIGTLTISNQMRYIRNKKLGFDKNQVVILPQMDDALRRNYASARRRLLNLPGVTAVAASSQTPGRAFSMTAYYPEGFSDDQPQMLQTISVDSHFIPMMGIELADGRNFSETMSTDSEEAVIINQAAVRKFGWDRALGKRFRRPLEGTPEEPPPDRIVIGVVEDFHLRSLHSRIDPLFMTPGSDSLRLIMVRIATGNISDTLARLEGAWKELAPNRAWEYRFLDESFEDLYRSDRQLGNLTMTFSLLAVFIGCLGLFGMSAFTAQRRTKEIGIRKVLGATVPNLIRLLSRETLILVGVANLIAWPAAYYLMHRWLAGFAYRAGISPFVFLSAAGMSLAVALLTVSYQSVKAALGDPVRSLRYE